MIELDFELRRQLSLESVMNGKRIDQWETTFKDYSNISVDEIKMLQDTEELLDLLDRAASHRALAVWEFENIAEEEKQSKISFLRDVHWCATQTLGHMRYWRNISSGQIEHSVALDRRPKEINGRGNYERTHYALRIVIIVLLVSIL